MIYIFGKTKHFAFVIFSRAIGYSSRFSRSPPSLRLPPYLYWRLFSLMLTLIPLQVSDEAKDFIRRCLTADPTLRPDVNELCLLTYMRNQSQHRGV